MNLNLKKSKQIISRLTPFIGIVLFVLIARKINFSYYLHELPPINWWLILAAPALMALMLLIKSWRWRMILKKQGIAYSFKRSLGLYLMGIYFGAITPSRVGELGKIYYLKKDQRSHTDSSIVTILDKIIDFGFVLVFGLAGLALYHKYFQLNTYFMAGGLTVLIIVLASLYYVKSYLPKLHEKISQAKQKFKSTILNYHFSDYLSILISTIISWLIYFMIAYVLGRSIGLEINFWYVALVMNLASLASILPISIMGLGTRESVFIFFYLIQGANKEMAVAVSMLIFLNNLLPVIAGFIIWLMKNKRVAV